MKLLIALCLVAAATQIAHSQREGCASTTDYIFLLDSSGSIRDNSMRANNWNIALRFLYDVILNLGRELDKKFHSASSGMRFALVQYARGTAKTTFGLNVLSDYGEAANAVTKAESLSPDWDNPMPGLEVGLEEAKRHLRPKRSNDVRNAVLVIFSDFQERITTATINKTRQLERDHNVTIVTVGIYGYSDTYSLSQLATPRRGGQNTVFSENHSGLQTYIAKLINTMCESGGGGPGQPAYSCLRDVVFALDASYSMSYDGWTRLKNYAARLAGNMFQEDINTRVGIVTFSSSAAVSSPLGPYTRDLAYLIQGINHPQLLTNHAAALRKAASMMNDPNRLRLIVIITDGITTQDVGEDTRLATKYRQDGIKIAAVGVGKHIDSLGLEQLVGRENVNSSLFWSPDFGDEISSQLTQIASVASCPARLPDPTNPPICIDRPAEIVIMVDSSGSIVEKGVSGTNNWTLMKGFVINIIRNILSQRRNSRIGVVLFSDDAFDVETLSSDAALLERKVRAQNHMNGFTNQGAAFQHAKNIFKGARSNSYQYALMITDGEETINNGSGLVGANLLKGKGITVIMVAVTGQYDMNNLRSLATSSQYVFEVPAFTGLNERLTDVIQTTTYCPQTTIAPPTPPPVCYAANVVFVMDTSGSIPEKGIDNPRRLKEFIKATGRQILRRYPLTKFGLVIFSDNATVILSLRDYRSFQQFVNAVDGVNQVGFQTNLAEGIRVARIVIQEGATSVSEIILATDGRPTAKQNQEVKEAEITRSFDIGITSIGITYDVDQNLLTKLSGNSDRTIIASNFQELQGDLPLRVAEVACREGGSAIQPTGAPRCDYGELDIVFILDASGSITEINGSNWYNALQMVSESIQFFANKNQKSRFAFVVFSTVARVEFHLSDDVSNLLRKLREGNIGYDQDRTNMADGFRKGRDAMQYARPKATKIAIFITDGKPNEEVDRERDEAEELKRMGAEIVPVGITGQPDFNLLQSLGTTEVVRAPNFVVLTNQIERLTNVACNGPSNNGNNGNNGYNGNNGNGGQGGNTVYPIYNPGPQCPKAYIVLALDVSSRLNQAGLPYANSANSDGGVTRMIELAEELINKIIDQYSGAELALVTFDETARIVRDFPEYKGVKDFMDYLDTVEPVRSRESNIAAALRATRTIVSPGQVKYSVVYVFTDGVATYDDGIQYNIASELRTLNCKVMAVALTPQANFRGLEKMTEARELVFDLKNYRFGNPTNITTLVDQVTADCSLNLVSLQLASPVCSADIAFIVDASGSQSSFNPGNWGKLRNFMVEVIEEYAHNSGIRVRFGIISFAETAEEVLPLTSNLASVRYLIENLKFKGGRANYAAALHTAYSFFDTTKVKKIALLLSNRNTEMRFFETFNEADRLKARSVDVVPVRIGTQPRTDFLARIAGDVREVVMIPNHDHLLNNVHRIIETGCGNYYKDENAVFEDTIPVIPDGPGEGAPRRSSSSSTTTTTTTTTTTPRPTPSKPTKRTTTLPPDWNLGTRRHYGTTKAAPAPLDCNFLDISLIVDSSDELQLNPSRRGSSNWDLVKQALQTLMETFRVSRYNTKVALVQYASDPAVTFNFRKYETSRRLMDALSRITLVGAGKNLADAFKFTKDQLFTNMDRSSARNLAIAIVEGYPINPTTNTRYEADDLKAKSDLFVISIGRGLDNFQLNNLKSYATPGYFYSVRDFNDLINAIPKISQMICGASASYDP